MLEKITLIILLTVLAHAQEGQIINGFGNNIQSSGSILPQQNPSFNSSFSQNTGQSTNVTNSSVEVEIQNNDIIITIPPDQETEVNIDQLIENMNLTGENIEDIIIVTENPSLVTGTENIEFEIDIIPELPQSENLNDNGLETVLNLNQTSETGLSGNIEEEIVISNVTSSSEEELILVLEQQTETKPLIISEENLEQVILVNEENTESQNSTIGETETLNENNEFENQHTEAVIIPVGEETHIEGELHSLNEEGVVQVLTENITSSEESGFENKETESIHIQENNEEMAIVVEASVVISQEEEIQLENSGAIANEEARVQIENEFENPNTETTAIIPIVEETSIEAELHSLNEGGVVQIAPGNFTSSNEESRFENKETESVHIQENNEEMAIVVEASVVISQEEEIQLENIQEVANEEARVQIENEFENQHTEAVIIPVVEETHIEGELHSLNEEGVVQIVPGNITSSEESGFDNNETESLGEHILENNEELAIVVEVPLVISHEEEIQLENIQEVANEEVRVQTENEFENQNTESIIITPIEEELHTLNEEEVIQVVPGNITSSEESGFENLETGSIGEHISENNEELAIVVEVPPVISQEEEIQLDNIQEVANEEAGVKIENELVIPNSESEVAINEENTELIGHLGQNTIKNNEENSGVLIVEESGEIISENLESLNENNENVNIVITEEGHEILLSDENSEQTNVNEENEFIIEIPETIIAEEEGVVILEENNESAHESTNNEILIVEETHEFSNEEAISVNEENLEVVPIPVVEIELEIPINEETNLSTSEGGLGGVVVNGTQPSEETEFEVNETIANEETIFIIEESSETNLENQEIELEVTVVEGPQIELENINEEALLVEESHIVVVEEELDFPIQVEENIEITANEEEFIVTGISESPSEIELENVEISELNVTESEIVVVPIQIVISGEETEFEYEISINENNEVTINLEEESPVENEESVEILVQEEELSLSESFESIEEELGITGNEELEVIIIEESMLLEENNEALLENEFELEVLEEAVNENESESFFSEENNEGLIIIIEEGESIVLEENTETISTNEELEIEIELGGGGGIIIIPPEIEVEQPEGSGLTSEEETEWILESGSWVGVDEQTGSGISEEELGLGEVVSSGEGEWHVIGGGGGPILISPSESGLEGGFAEGEIIIVEPENSNGTNTTTNQTTTQTNSTTGTTGSGGTGGSGTVIVTDSDSGSGSGFPVETESGSSETVVVEPGSEQETEMIVVEENIIVGNKHCELVKFCFLTVKPGVGSVRTCERQLICLEN